MSLLWQIGVELQISNITQYIDKKTGSFMGLGVLSSTGLNGLF